MASKLKEQLYKFSLKYLRNKSGPGASEGRFCFFALQLVCCAGAMLRPAFFLARSSWKLAQVLRSKA